MTKKIIKAVIWYPLALVAFYGLGVVLHYLMTAIIKAL